MIQCNNIQSTINHRQQFTRQFYECSLMWNVNKFQREMPGLSAAPSPKCPVCSGRCLDLATHYIKKILRFWHLLITHRTHVHRYTHTHTRSYQLYKWRKQDAIISASLNLKSVMVKLDMCRVLFKKIQYLPLLPPPSLPLLLLRTAKVQKKFTCCLEGEVGCNIKVRYA